MHDNEPVWINALPAKTTSEIIELSIILLDQLHKGLRHNSNLQYKNAFNQRKLYDILKSNSFTKNLNYDNLYNNYDKILN